MAKVARCGSVTCWRIASAVFIVLGVVCLATGAGLYFNGDPSTHDCKQNDNYMCNSGCFDESFSNYYSDYGGDCDVFDTTIFNTDGPCLSWSNPGTLNVYKACKCATGSAKCEKSRGIVAAYGLGAALLTIGIIFLCGCCPCLCFATDEYCEEERCQTQQAVVMQAQVYDPNAPPGHPAPVTMGNPTMGSTSKATAEPTIQA